MKKRIHTLSKIVLFLLAAFFFLHNVMGPASFHNAHTEFFLRSVPGQAYYSRSELEQHIRSLSALKLRQLQSDQDFTAVLILVTLVFVFSENKKAIVGNP